MGRLENRVSKLEGRGHSEREAQLADFLAGVRQRERAGLDAEGLAELEAVDTEIAALDALACERAGLQPPAMVTLEAAIRYAAASTKAQREQLTNDERERLARAQDRRKELTWRQKS